MAKERWFTGFEVAQGHDWAGTLQTVQAGIVCDGSARTGDFHFQLWRPTASGGAVSAKRDFTGTYNAVGAGDTVIARVQLAMLYEQFPSTANVQAFGFGDDTVGLPGMQCAGIIQTDGTFAVKPLGLARVDAGYRLSLNRWYVLRMELRYQRTAGTPLISGTIQLYDGTQIDAPTGPTLLAQVSANGAAAIGSFLLRNVLVLGSGNPVGSQIVKYDDIWYSIADGTDANTATNPDLAWPLGSRVAPVPITRQLTAGWTGAVNLVQDIPNSGVAGNEQTQTGSGAVTTFGHDNAVPLGLVPPSLLLPEDLPDAPAFSGQSPPGNLWTSENYTTEPSLPVPTLVSATPNSGGGSFQTGVWVSVATVRFYQPPGATPHTIFVGTPSAATFINGTAYGNYSLDVTATLNAATPPDAFTIPGNVNSAYNRYGIIFLVYSGFNAAGQWNPFTNLTNLQTINGMPLITVYDTEVNRGVPYDNTHPELRPATKTVRFLGGDYTLLGSDLGGPISGGGTSGGVFQFYQVVSTTTPTVTLPICAAIKVYANIKRTATPGTDSILINGVATSVASGVNYLAQANPQIAFDWATKTADQFDAFTYGVRTDSGIATQLGNCIAEVLTAGPCVKRQNSFGTYQQKAGIYVSNNGFQQVVVGFKPSAVFVKRIGATAAAGAVKAWWMGGTMSWPINQITPESIAIMQLNDTGFVVGPANNANGVAANYAYVAIQDGQQDVVNGSYLITASYFREVSLAGGTINLGIPLAFVNSWTPTAGFIVGNGSTIFKTSEMGSTNSILLGSGSAFLTNGLTAFGNGNFTIGANSAVANGGQYPYLMFREDAGALLSSVFAHGSFAGTGGVLVVPTPFASEFVGLGIPNGGYVGHWRSASGAVPANSNVWTGGNGVINNITAQGALDFTVGPSASVVGQTSYWFIFKGAGAFGNEGGPDPGDVIPPDGGGESGPSLGDLCGGGGMKVATGTINGHGCTAC